jgi:hypothetical protein
MSAGQFLGIQRTPGLDMNLNSFCSRYVITVFGYQRNAMALSLGKFVRRTRWAVKQPSWGKKREMPTIFWWEPRKEAHHLEDPEHRRENNEMRIV